jgi:phosphatidylglycerophosphate synthase
VNAVELAVILLPTVDSERSREPGSPAQKLLGLTLLERTVLATAQSGVKLFLLVGDGGGGWENVTARLSEDTRVIKRSLQLEFLPVARLKDMARDGKVRRPFWLFRGHIVFDPGLPAVVASAERGEDETLHLTGGLSLCPPSVFPHLAEALAPGGALLSEAGLWEELLGESGYRTFEAGPRLCLEVSDRASFKAAERGLLDTARKATDGFFSRHFNRHISLFLTRLFLKTGIAPSVQSVATLLIGLASGWFISRGGYGPSALGACLFDFASIFDGCDGENARLTFRTSKLGGFLDITGDAFIFVLFFLCLPVGLYRASRQAVWLWFGGLALVSMGLFYLQLVRYMKKARLGNNIIAIAKEIEANGAKPGLAGRLDAIAARIAFIYRRDFFSTAACLIILVGGAKVLMALLGVFMPLQAFYMFLFSQTRRRPAAGRR